MFATNVAWKQAEGIQHSAKTDAAVGIDLQQLNRGQCSAGPAVQSWAIPLKMIVPGIDTRIEQPDKFFRTRYKSRDITALMRIAQGTTPAQILHIGWTLVLLSADVIGLVR